MCSSEWRVGSDWDRQDIRCLFRRIHWMQEEDYSKSYTQLRQSIWKW